MNLTRYKEQVVETFFLGVILAAGFSCGTIYFLQKFSDMDIGRSVMIGLFVALIVTVAFTTWIHRQISAPLIALINVIRHVSDEENVPAPDLSKIGVGRDAVMSASTAVNQLASGQAHVNKRYAAEHDYMQALLTESPLPIIVIDHSKKVRFFNTAASKYIKSTVGDGVNIDINMAFEISYPSEETLDVWLEDAQKTKIRATQIWERVRIEVEDRAHIFDMIAAYNKNETHGIETTIMLFDHSDRYRADDSEVSFVSLAVHELRTPITVLKGYMEVFEDELGPSLNEEQKQFMQKMNVSASQLSTFVNNVLNVVKVDSDEMRVHIHQEDWPTILRTAANEFQIRAKLRGRSIKLEVDDSMPPVAADKVSTYEVLSNLVDNAIKYSMDGGEIVLKSEVKDGMIETTVQDFGIGIPSNLIDHLFDKFYRSHRSRDTVGGTGLGLYLSKAIIEAHGGTIWVRSIEGKGSTFGFTLPTYESVAKDIKEEGNKKGEIVRAAHGWIKNHSFIKK